MIDLTKEHVALVFAQAIIDKFGQMAGAIEKLDKALTNCRTAQRT